MTTRRNFVMGAACIASAAGAYAITPRRQFNLLGGRELSQIVPPTFGHWTSEDVSDLVAPKIEGSLASRLYNQTLGRVYRNEALSSEIMMLLAYGEKNNDELQLHRPESCYPAFGFELSMSSVSAVKLAGTTAVPIRRLVADAPGRRENIVYWSRLGEYLPVDAGQQRMDRLRTAMSGYVSDGLLARFSMISPDPKFALPVVEEFISELLLATRRDDRRALVGSSIAKALIAANV